MAKWERATHTAIVVSLIAMGIFGLGGYATFINTTESDVLNNYCNYDNLMTVSRVFFALNVLITFPLECFVSREVFINLLFGEGHYAVTDEEGYKVVKRKLLKSP